MYMKDRYNRFLDWLVFQYWLGPVIFLSLLVLLVLRRFFQIESQYFDALILSNIASLGFLLIGLFAYDEEVLKRIDHIEKRELQNGK